MAAMPAGFNPDWSAALAANWPESRLRQRQQDGTNSSLNTQEDDDRHFRRCWSRQDCRACLDQHACSWCPFTSTCVPNNCPIPALAPAFDEMVCPYWAERWELRTRPLGCQVSTITTLTALVAGSGTLFVAFLICMLILGIRSARRQWKARQRQRQQNQQGSQEQEDVVSWWRPVVWVRRTIAEQPNDLSSSATLSERPVGPASVLSDASSETLPPSGPRPADERTPLLAP